jgi:WD40 repeat protein
MPFPLLTALVISFTAPGSGNDDDIPEEVLTRLKAATVRVVVENGRLKGSGSGFVVEVKQQSVYVATNEHVIRGANRADQSSIRVVFHSGTSRERTFAARVAASDPRHDLAILEVGPIEGPPRPIELGGADKPYETMAVYVLGFPFGNVNLSFGAGAVSSIKKGPRGVVTRVRLDGELNPGNSGGPVVDETGRLVGVAQAAMLGLDRIGFAIPADDLQTMLEGRLDDGVESALSLLDGPVLLESSIQVIDPLNRLSNIARAIVPAAAIAAPLQPDKNGNWPALPGAVTKTIVPGRNRYDVLPGSGGDFLVQTSYRTGKGATVVRHAPVPYRLPRTLQPGEALEGWGNVHDSFQASRFALGWDELTITASPQYASRARFKRLARPGQDRGPSVLGAVRGDYVARVRVEVTSPTNPRAGDSTATVSFRKLQSAGLLLKTYQRPEVIRLARVAILKDEVISQGVVLDGDMAGLASFPTPRMSHFREIPDVPVDLRLERSGSTLIASYTLDDGFSESFPALTIDGTRDWELGVSASNSIDEGCRARFKGFEVATEAERESELSIAKHTEPAGSLAMSADGRRAASFANWKFRNPVTSHDQPDQTARVWDLKTGKELFNRPSRSPFFTAGALLSEGRRLLTGESEGWLRLWEVETGKHLIQTRQGKGPVVALAVSSDGQLVVTGEDRLIHLWKSDDLSEVRQFGEGEIPQEISILTFTPDGHRILSGHRDGTVIEWDVSSGRRARLINPPERGGPVLAFSADSTKALHAASRLLLWGLGGNEPVRSFDLPRGVVSAAAISPDGRLVMASGGAPPKDPQATPHPRRTTSPAVPPDEKVTIWDVATGKKLRTFFAAGGEVTCMAVTPDSRKVFVGGTDRSLRLWPLPESGSEPVAHRIVHRLYDPTSGELGRLFGGARPASRPIAKATTTALVSPKVTASAPGPLAPTAPASRSWWRSRRAAIALASIAALVVLAWVVMRLARKNARQS